MTKREFHVHEQVFSQSPVFRRFCQNHTGSMRLMWPDDVRDREMRRVLEYLYLGKLESNSHGFLQGGLSIVQEMAELYVIASRLGLGRLMELVVRELEKQDFLRSDPTVLFLTAERIYPATPKTDRAFKDFFVSALISCYENCEDFPEEHAAKLSTAGGPLAFDIYQAQRANNIELRAENIELGAEVRGKPDLKSTIHASQLITHTAAARERRRY